MAIPIIFFHYGNPKYLKYSLKQAKFFNPASEVYLLGDKKNNRYPFITHIMADRYQKDAAPFTQIYKHWSTNAEYYELNCFLRWFYIEAFCRENNIEQFIYLDSDVLLFQNVTEIEPYLTNCSIANTGDVAGVPAFTYFENYKAIKDFCDYLMYAYTDEKCLKELELFYEPVASTPGAEGAVSDMILFQHYFRDYPDKTKKIDLITAELAVDENISQPDGYEMESGKKKVYWQDDLPYCRQLATGKLIRFASLHYQGDSKALMVEHFKAQAYAFQRFLEINKVSEKVKNAKRSIKKIFK